MRSGSVREHVALKLDALSVDLGLMIAGGLPLVEPCGRQHQQIAELGERAGPQTQGHRADVDMDDVALAAELDDVAAVGGQELEAVSVAHVKPLSKLKSVFKYNLGSER